MTSLNNRTYPCTLHFGGRLLLTALITLLFVANGGWVGTALAAPDKKDPATPEDQIDRILSLLSPPPEFPSLRDLFLHYKLTVKSAKVVRDEDQNGITVRIDFFLPVPPDCRPTSDEHTQYYLQDALWSKPDGSDFFNPVNQWARHLSGNESEWLENIPCYP